MMRFFVSSTFRDMNLERDAINLLVAPEVNAMAREYGESVGFCDLRWGVDTSELETEEGSRKVLSVCLDEIDRCDPYMIVLLGERYGWIPEEQLIGAAIRDRRDFALEELEKSVTALEIEYGALCNAHRLKHTLFYFRELSGEAPPEYLAEGQRQQEKLAHLKQRICALTENGVKTYRVTWDVEQNTLVGLDDFVQQVSGDIQALLEDEWKALAALTPRQRDLRGQWDYAGQKAAQFRAREDMLQQLLTALETDDLVALQGSTGSGKSTLMGRLAQTLQAQGQEVLPIFCGSSQLCSTALDLIRYMVDYLETKLDLPHFEQEGQNRSLAQWRERLADTVTAFVKRTEGQLVLLIDGVDQLVPEAARDYLQFIPDNLSHRVKLVFSCLDSFSVGRKLRLCRVAPLAKADREMIVRGILADTGRELDRAVLQAMVEKPGADNPLYLSLLVQRLNMMDKDDYSGINAMGGQMWAITSWQKQIIDQCPDSLEGLSVHLLEETSRQLGGKLAVSAAQYLAVSRHGLREQDLAGLFAQAGEPWNSLDFSRFLRYLRGFFFQRKDGRWDFFHKCFREGICARWSLEALHKPMCSWLRGLPQDDPVRQLEVTYHTMLADEKAFLVDYVSDRKLPDDAVRAAAADMVEVCRADEGAWLQALLADGEQYGCGKDYLHFTVSWLSDAFPPAQRERLLRQKILAQTAVLGRRLCAGSEDADIHLEMAYICSHLSGALTRLDGQENREQAGVLLEEALAFAKRGQELTKDDPEQKKRTDRAVVRRLSELGTHLKLVKNEPIFKALELYSQAISLWESVEAEHTPKDWDALLSDLYAGLARVFYAEKEYAQAIDTFEQMHAILRRRAQRDGADVRGELAYVLSFLCLCHFRLKRSTGAAGERLAGTEQCALTFSRWMEEWKRPKQRPFNPFNFDVKQENKQEEMTPEEAKRAELFEKRKDAVGDWEKAMAYLRESTQITVAMAAERMDALNLTNLAIQYQDAARYYGKYYATVVCEEMVENMSRAMEIMRQLARELRTTDARDGMVLIARQLANLYRLQNTKASLRKAWEVLEEALPEARALYEELNTATSKKHYDAICKTTYGVLLMLGDEAAFERLLDVLEAKEAPLPTDWLVSWGGLLDRTNDSQISNLKRTMADLQRMKTEEAQAQITELTGIIAEQQFGITMGNYRLLEHLRQHPRKAWSREAVAMAVVIIDDMVWEVKPGGGLTKTQFDQMRLGWLEDALSVLEEPVAKGKDDKAATKVWRGLISAKGLCQDFAQATGDPVWTEKAEAYSRRKLLLEAERKARGQTVLGNPFAF